MEISKRDWKRYIDRLSAIDKKAADTMQFWMQENPDADVEELIWVAQNVAGRYGEAAGALACEMYDAVAAAQGVSVPPAEIADVPDYGETAKAVRGTMKNKQNTVPATVGRLVKRVGADTMLKNADRDHAQFAWVPMGDTCAFCLTLASRGWQYMSKDAMKHGHAEHIHANCDCQYAIRFDEESTVEGYDPERYREMYDNAEGSTPQEKINSMRREIAASRAKPETVGNLTLYRKKHPEPIERALRNTNPLYKTGPEYRVNCQRCVPTYELQRRGYIVRAKPALVDKDDYISDNDVTVKRGIWLKPFKGMKWSRSGVTMGEIEKAMSQFGDGARAEVYVSWSDRKGSHVFIAEQSQGKTLFIDPQTGDGDCSRYFTEAEERSIMFARIDGLSPIDEIDLFTESAR